MADSYSKKIVLLGDGAVGKTSLVRRFVHSTFSEEYIKTIGVVTYTKDVSIPKGDFKLVIWDVAGQKLRESPNLANLKGASGAIFVVDGTRRDTVETMIDYASTLKRVAGEVPAVLVCNKEDVLNTFEFYSGMSIAQVRLEDEYKKQFNTWMHAINKGIVAYYEKNYPSELERLYDIKKPFFNPVTDAEMKRLEKVLGMILKQSNIPSYFSSAKTGKNVNTAFNSLTELLAD